ncbi:MAG: undecaprenyl-diphosphatase [Gammaproteobacteria bacterium 39-13]|nr:undecaprenyl-diphosphate phosphatase [Gammaproteobacteria bacterium]OJV86984.1 MAG: undecaprenyl-diphosphatase [Gammaproteobacteria bacterium 39-13]
MSQTLETIALAIVQGLTEFLPVSSSAHLILVPLLTGWPDQGLAFDIAVHIGTLVAVCIYFRKEIFRLLWGFWRSLIGRPSRFYSALAWQLIVASVPIALIGLLAHDFVATTLRSPLVIACSTIGFGLLLCFSDYFRTHPKRLGQLQWKDVLIIGMAQTLALIPGTSRSGITLTAGLSLGFNRASSAKFSFLLSIPVILLAGTYEGYKVATSPHAIAWGQLSLGIAFAALSAYFCIHAFFRLIRKIGMLPFVCYRLMLGAFLLLMFW